jgi:hypothetical protein
MTAHSNKTDPPLRDQPTRKTVPLFSISPASCTVSNRSAHGFKDFDHYRLRILLAADGSRS